MKKIMKKCKKLVSFGLIIALGGLIIGPIQETKAATLTAISDTMSRLIISQKATHTIQFTTPTGIAPGDTVTLTFENDFDISSVVAADVTLEGAVVASTGVDGQVLTITAAATGNTVAATGTADIVISDSHITNPTATTNNPYTIDIAGTFGDTGSMAVYILTDDQVVISATVDPILAFAIEGGYEGSEPAAVDFGTLIPNFYHKLLGEKPAYAGIEFTANPAAAETVTVNGQAYTFVATQAEADDASSNVLQGASWDDTAENLYRAINNTDSDVRAGLDPADPSQIWIVTVAAGVGGNAYTIVDGTTGDVTLTHDSGTFVDGQAGSNYRDANLGFGEVDGTDMENESQGTNLVVSTNGVGGYVITVQDNTNGLHNTGAGWGIPDWSGQYGFGIWAKARNAKYGECDPAANEIIADAYDVDATPVPGTLSDTAATLASYSGPTAEDHISIEYVVRIDADYPAGNYSDTLTYIATRTF